MQPIVTFGAENPHDRIGVSVGRGRYRRSGAAECSAPSRAHAWRRSRAHLQHEKAAATLRTLGAIRMKGDEHAVLSWILGLIERGCGNDRTQRDTIHRELTANASKVFAIEQIRFAILP